MFKMLIPGRFGVTVLVEHEHSAQSELQGVVLSVCEGPQRKLGDLFVISIFLSPDWSGWCEEAPTLLLF